MAGRKRPKPTAKEAGRQYKRYKKITKGAAPGATMSKKQFIKFNYPGYYKTPTLEEQLKKRGYL